MRISDWSSDVCSSDLAFHREAQRGVRVLRLTRLVHALVGAHRGTAGITMRLTRDLHAIDAECRIRRCADDAGQRRYRLRAGDGHVIENLPAARTFEVGQPAPRLDPTNARVVVSQI